MKSQEEISEEIERLKRINEKAPYDKELFFVITHQINTLMWVLQ